MMHAIETSTSALHHLIYHGLYYTYIGEWRGAVPYENREELDDEIGNKAVEFIGNMFYEILPDDFGFDQDYHLEYMHTYHPRYYNFETDHITFKFEYSEDLKNYFEFYAGANKDSFQEFLEKHYTSRDGFISFTPNNWDDWYNGWEEDDWRCGSALLSFYINTSTTESELDEWTQEFEDDVRVLIEENYIPYEYAEEFENGYIGYACNGEDWDVWHAYLIDDNKKVVNHIEIADSMGELNGAFAAWDNMEYDLIKDFNMWCMPSKSCDVCNLEYIVTNKA